MSQFIKCPAPGIYRSKVAHVEKALDELPTIALQMRMKRSVRRPCAVMERILEDYPCQPYSNSLRCHKSGLSYADSCIKRVSSLLYNEFIIDQFDLLTYGEIEGLLSEALETLTVIIKEAEANAPGYLRKGPAQPQRLKPLPVAKKSP